MCWYSLFKNRHEFKGFTSFGSQSYLLFQVVFKARWLINKVMQYLIKMYKTKTIMLITGINILVLEDIYQRLIYEPVWNMGRSLRSQMTSASDERSSEVTQCMSSVCKACFGPARASALMKTETSAALHTFCFPCSVFSDAVVLFIFTGITQWLVRSKRSGNYAVGALVFHNLSFLFKLQWKRLVW